MQENKILAGLPEQEQSRLRPYLKNVSLEFKQTLVEFDQPIEYVYFLESVVTSTIVNTPNGETIEVGLMGAEGFVGLSLLYGVRKSNATVVVQIAGQAFRMKAEDFNLHIKDYGGICLELLLRYANYFAIMVQQHAACNATHNIKARMCRWILLTHDRVQGDEFALTQEYLALMLGSRRPTVSSISQELKQEGLINYTRGNLTVTNRSGLEAGSCQCYELIKELDTGIFQKNESSNSRK